MARTRLRGRPQVLSPIGKSVTSPTSPYFIENHDLEVKNKAVKESRRRSVRTSVTQKSKIAQPTEDEDIQPEATKSTESPECKTEKSDRKCKQKKKMKTCPQRKQRTDKKKQFEIKSEPSDSADDFVPDEDSESGTTDDSYRPIRRKSRTSSKVTIRAKKSSNATGKRSTQIRKGFSKQSDWESGHTGGPVTSALTAAECSSSSDASDSVEITKTKRSKKRRNAPLHLFSEFTDTNNLQVSVKPHSASPKVTYADDSDDEDWEEVNDATVGEADLMATLLGAKSNAQSVHTKEANADAVVTVSVPLGSVKLKNSTKDPATLEAQARARQMKEVCLSMHVAHVLCYLAYSRSLNKTCDSPLYRALGLSLLGNVASVRSKTNSSLDQDNWTVDHLASCLTVFLALRRIESKGDESKTLITQRIFTGTCSTTDCALLFISALRVLNFDVRLVVALTPLPLKPPASPETGTSFESVPPKDIPVKTQNKETTRINRKIISSDESDFEPVIPKRPRKPSSSKFDPPKYYVFAEVYLPLKKRWICIDFNSPTGSVDKVPRYPSLFYVIGITTTRSSNPNTQPYVGRNPIDLTSRYDPHWCIQSRPHRLPAERLSNLLNYQRVYFTRDAAWNSSLVARDETLPTVQRDRADEDSIRSELLAQPLPVKMQDFKNHPLYVLQRHLLKFEVIHPPDALPLGFFRGEPVYSRDCLHLCHTRESWLKEAKMVRPHEKPAKVVKARLSLKRKLLQGSDPTPPTVEVFGSWQVEDYQPPVAQNGVVPRNAHGTIDLFKPCMLPIGCAHICLTGIQHIAKKLGVDCAPAVTGWKFHGAGWAIPIVNGYVVCKESVSVLIDAWRATRMNAAKAIAEERSERALDNWRRLVRGLFLWHRVKAQFALAPLHSEGPQAAKSKAPQKRQSRKSNQGKSGQATKHTRSLLDLNDPDPTEVGSLVVNEPLADSGGWQRLGCGELAHELPIFPGYAKPSSSIPENKPKAQTKSRKTIPTARRKSKGRAKRKRRTEETSSEEEEEEEEESEPTPDTSTTEENTDCSEEALAE